MKEQRPINLHFFTKENVLNFGAVCRGNQLKYDVTEREGSSGYYVTTEPVTSTLRSKVIAEWAKASMEVL